jgi:hypothetical protein
MFTVRKVRGGRGGKGKKLIPSLNKTSLEGAGAAKHRLGNKRGHRHAVSASDGHHSKVFVTVLMFTIALLAIAVMSSVVRSNAESGTLVLGASSAGDNKNGWYGLKGNYATDDGQPVMTTCVNPGVATKTTYSGWQYTGLANSIPTHDSSVDCHAIAYLVWKANSGETSFAKYLESMNLAMWYLQGYVTVNWSTGDYEAFKYWNYASLAKGNIYTNKSGVYAGEAAITREDGAKVQQIVAEAKKYTGIPGPWDYGSKYWAGGNYQSVVSPSPNTNYSPSVTTTATTSIANPRHDGIVSGHIYQIASARDTNYKANVTNNSAESDVQIQLYNDNTNATKFVAYVLNDGSVSFKKVASDMYVGANGFSPTTRVKQYDWVTRWSVEKQSDGTTLIRHVNSKLAMNMMGGTASNGVRIQLYPDDGTPSCRWNLVDCGANAITILKSSPQTVTSPKHDGITDGHAYTFITKLNGTSALDVASNSRTAGATVDVWQKNGSDAQTFVANVQSDGSVTLRHEGTNMFLGSGTTGTISNGTAVSQYSTASVTTWSVEQDPDNTAYVRLVDVNSGKSVHTEYDKTDNGTKVHFWDKGTSDSWQLIDLGAPAESTDAPDTMIGGSATNVVRDALTFTLPKNAGGATAAKQRVTTNVTLHYEGNASNAASTVTHTRTESLHDTTGDNNGNEVVVSNLDFKPSDFGWTTWQSGTYWFSINIPKSGNMTAAVSETNKVAAETFTVENTMPVTGKICVTKSSSLPDYTNAHSDVFSLANAVYGIYTDKACTTAAKDAGGQDATITTDTHGSGTSGDLLAGTYYLKEKTNPQGYALSATVTQATVTAAGTTNVAVTDKPITVIRDALMKKLDGSYVTTAGKFSFTNSIYHKKDGTVSLVRTDTATNDDQGKITFPDYDVTETGEYLLLSSETTGNDPNMQYDKHCSALEYTIEQDNNALVITGTQRYIIDTVPDMSSVTSIDTILANAKADNSGNGCTFSNDTLGEIILQKVVDGNANDSTPFTYDVTLKNASDAPVTSVMIDGKSESSPTGVYKVKVSATKQATITKLPIGTTYSVSEESMQGYSQVSSSGANGEITTSANVATVSFTNAQTERRKLTLKKIVAGGDDADVSAKYAFMIVLSDMGAGWKASTSNGDAIVADASGKATVSVLLKDGESFVITNLPVGTKYVVTETGGKWHPSFAVVASNGGTVVKSRGTASVGSSLATASETLSSGEDDSVTFTNVIPLPEVVLSLPLTGMGGVPLVSVIIGGVAGVVCVVVVIKRHSHGRLR